MGNQNVLVAAAGLNRPPFFRSFIFASLCRTIAPHLLSEHLERAMNLSQLLCQN